MTFVIIGLSKKRLSLFVIRRMQLPYLPKRPCKFPFCPNLITSKSAYCPTHQTTQPTRKDDRPSPSARGYGYAWRRIREKVLKDWNIPREDWPLYDIDHTPPYDPTVHTKYKLTPRLHADHSRKTATEDVKRDKLGRICGRRGG